MRHLCLLAFLLLGSCASDESTPPGPTETNALSAAERSVLHSGRILFGHQSVGRDILAGIAEFDPELRILSSAEPAGLETPGLMEATVGVNGDPLSKDREFLELVSELNPGDTAFYKYCFADMQSGTDPDSLFARYEQVLATAKERGVRVVSVTMPLTTIAPAWKRWSKRALGRVTDLELNAKRHHFNELLRKNYPAESMIDLAHMESTLEDGSARSATFSGQPLQILASEYTEDGAHLNERGRRHVARLFLESLSRAMQN